MENIQKLISKKNHVPLEKMNFISKFLKFSISAPAIPKLITPTQLALGNFPYFSLDFFAVGYLFQKSLSS